MIDVRLVRDLMTVGVATCPADTPAADIARLLLNTGVEGVVVLHHDGHAVGMVSQDELVHAYAYDNWQDLTAEAIMREEVVEVPPDIPITAAAQIMEDLGVRMVFLMHNSEGIRYPAAALSYQHILRHMAAASEDDLADLGIKASRLSPVEAFKQKRDAARRNAPPYYEE